MCILKVYLGHITERISKIREYVVVTKDHLFMTYILALLVQSLLIHSQ